MDLLEKSKKQIKKDFEKMMVKFKNNFNEINIEEKMDEIVVDNTIKNKKELIKWCYLKENSRYMLDSEFDSDTCSSLIDIQRGALQIYLYEYIYELFENKKKIKGENND